MTGDGKVAKIGGGAEGEVGENKVAGRRVGDSHLELSGRRWAQQSPHFYVHADLARSCCTCRSHRNGNGSGGERCHKQLCYAMLYQKSLYFSLLYLTLTNKLPP